MVQANCANTNAEIHAPLSSHPPAQIDVQCTLPGRGRRIGLRAGYRASEGHAGRAEAGRARAALRA